VQAFKTYYLCENMVRILVKNLKSLFLYTSIFKSSDDKIKYEYNRSLKLNYISIIFIRYYLCWLLKHCSKIYYWIHNSIVIFIFTLEALHLAFFVALFPIILLFFFFFFFF